MLFVGWGRDGASGECGGVLLVAAVVVVCIAFPEWGIVTGHADEAGRGGREGENSSGDRRAGFDMVLECWMLFSYIQMYPLTLTPVTVTQY